jgi:outer membrane protein
MRPYLLFPLLLLAAIAGAQPALTLKDAIHFGKANSPLIVIAANDRERAEAQATEALSSYLPQVNASGQLDNNLKRPTTILPPGVFSDQPTPVQFGTQYNTTLNIQAEQTLFDLASLNGIQAAGPNREMARIREEQAEEQLIYEASRAYAAALTTRLKVQLLDANQAQYDSLVPLMELRRSMGVAQALDVDRLEVARRNILSQRTVAQANMELSMGQLKQIIGMPLATDIVLVDTLPVGGQLIATTQGPFSLDRLNAYRYAETALLLNGIDVRRKRNAYLPTLSAFGRYGANAQGNDLGDSYDRWFDYATVGVKMNVPLYSGSRRSSQLKQSQLALSNAQQQLKLNSMAWELEEQNARTRMEATLANVENDDANLRLAEEVFRLTEKQYSLGAAPFSDVLNADYQLKEARNNYTASLLQYYLAIIDLNKALGTLIPFANSL